MNSRLALIGGEEFSDGFEDVHTSLLKDTGIAQPRLVFLPTCAADDGDEAIEYWCNTAREKFTALGASIETPRIVDAASANDEGFAQLMADADLIYFGGGYPHAFFSQRQGNLSPDPPGRARNDCHLARQIRSPARLHGCVSRQYVRPIA